MPQAALFSTADLPGLISVAVTPVALITTTSILLGSFTTKHNNLAVQLRSLSMEVRDEQTNAKRLRSLKRQIRFFLKRITAIWAACVCLYLALIAFVGMVLSVIGVNRFPRLTSVGFGELVVGLIFIGCAVFLELCEMYLARLTVGEEVANLDLNADA